MRVRVVFAFPDLLIFLSSFVPTLSKRTDMCTVGKSQLITAMESMIEVFKCYSSSGGDKYKLDFLELRRLIQSELSQYLQNCWDPRAVGMIMDDLDKNNDGSVSFEEFVALVTQLTVYSTGFFKGYSPVVIECGQVRGGRFQRL